MKVNICGIPHSVIYCEDTIDAGDTRFGQIEYLEAKIKINKNATKELQEETLCHEMVHGILVHIGRQDLNDDENFVQALGNAIFNGFEVKRYDESGDK